MSEPIKVGDLVQIVRTYCCHGQQYLGLVYQVTATHRANIICGRCRKQLGIHFLAETGRNSYPLHAPFACLKRIPPLSELESEKKKDEITA